MITPSDAKKFMKGLSKEAEAVIDLALRQGAEDRRWPVTISQRVIHVGDCDPLVIVTKYTDAGWKVSLMSDSRDGDYYQFEEPK